MSWIPKDRKVYIGKILDLREDDKIWYKLTVWEQNFCYGLYDKLFLDQQDITEPVERKLEEIHARFSR